MHHVEHRMHNTMVHASWSCEKNRRQWPLLYAVLSILNHRRYALLNSTMRRPIDVGRCRIILGVMWRVELGKVA